MTHYLPNTAAVNTALDATPQNIAQGSGEALQGSILCGIIVRKQVK